MQRRTQCNANSIPICRNMFVVFMRGVVQLLSFAKCDLRQTRIINDMILKSGNLGLFEEIKEYHVRFSTQTN